MIKYNSTYNTLCFVHLVIILICVISWLYVVANRVALSPSYSPYQVCVRVS